MSAEPERVRLRRQAARVVLLPWLLMTVALLGGLRVAARDRSLLFLPPPLVTLVLAALLAALFIRAGLVLPGRWLGSHLTVLQNLSHALTLVALFFLWTLWNDQFAPFDRRRLLRSLAVLVATAFALKHLLLSGLSVSPDGGGWQRRDRGRLLERVTLGTIDLPAHAPATGYLSFFTLALYVGALVLVRPAPDDEVVAIVALEAPPPHAELGA